MVFNSKNIFALLLISLSLTLTCQGRVLHQISCAAGDAACFCKAKTPGTYADTATKCANYFECVSSTQAFYRSCPPGLAFQQVGGYCDWPSNVQCAASPSPSPVPASPSPSPSPKSSPPPPVVVPSPVVPSPSPSPKASPPPPVVVPSPPSPSPKASPPPPTGVPSPSPSTSPSPGDACTSGDFNCFCKSMNGAEGMFADTKSGCKNYYWCTSTGNYYRSCQQGLLFSSQHSLCDWATNVVCSTTPTPEPTPSPSPVPSPIATPPSPVAISPSPSSPVPTPAPGTSTFKYVAYFQSWSDPWKGKAADSALANLPPYFTHVILSFMSPDATYSGGLTWAGTGLQFSSDPSVIKGAIALLKQRNPGTKVLVAVGGATYTNFKNMNGAAIAKFVADFGLDGVDLDYEPTNANCVVRSGAVSCATDAEFISSVNTLRTALPRPLILSTAPFSVGAYGEGSWAYSQPASQYTGVSVNMLKAVGTKLDLLNIMSYDASNAYNPKEALDAYRYYFKGDIVLGVEVANEAWGGHVINIPEVESISDYVKANGGNGMMLWSIQKPADQGPTATQISQTICSKLGLLKCSCGFNCPL